MKEKNFQIKIRRFRIEDYDAVMELWQVCGLPSKPKGRDSRGKIANEILKDTATFLVAELNGAIIGTVLATHDGRKGWINRLAVSPEFQHKGIARRLLEEAEKSLYDRGLEIIACLIEDHNEVSMKFFGRAGYTEHRDIIYFSRRKNPEV